VAPLDKGKGLDRTPVDAFPEHPPVRGRSTTFTFRTSSLAKQAKLDITDYFADGSSGAATARGHGRSIQAVVDALAKHGVTITGVKVVPTKSRFR
jgi:hypothetical protein